MFIITNIEDSLERPLLNSISKNIRFGIKTFDELINLNITFDIHDLVVMSLFRKILEQADGVFILIDHSSLSAAHITSRSIIEIYLSLIYILEDSDLLKNRALSYFLFHKDEELRVLNKQNNFDLLAKKHQKNELKSKMNDIRNLKKKSPYKEIINARMKLINYERNNRNIRYLIKKTKKSLV